MTTRELDPIERFRGGRARVEELGQMPFDWVSQHDDAEGAVPSRIDVSTLPILRRKFLLDEVNPIIGHLRVGRGLIEILLRDFSLILIQEGKVPHNLVHICALQKLLERSIPVVLEEGVKVIAKHGPPGFSDVFEEEVAPPGAFG